MFIKTNFPDFFAYKRVLDVGAGDINGCNKELFRACDYHGNDVVASPNTTIVSKTSDLAFEDTHFDTILSTECFEHDMHYKESLANIVRMLKPGGLFVFTCASTGRGEHGTRRTTPNCSFTTQLTDDDDNWADYYKNLTEEDVMEAIPCDEIFSNYAFYYNKRSHDLYFYGIKYTTEKVPRQRALPYIVPACKQRWP
jgi:SAM-dependent methyltransferase